jgi:phosphatidylglycerophosphate synthase
MNVASAQALPQRSGWPSGLTISRIFAGLSFPFGGQGVRLALLAYAALVDLVDGYWSRRRGLARPEPAVIDSIADKAVFLAVAGTLLWEGQIVWWQLLLVAARDLAVLGIALVVIVRGQARAMETAPLVIGQVVTWAQFAFLLTALLIPLAQQPMGIIAGCLSLLAATAYLQDAVGQVRNLRAE